MSSVKIAVACLFLLFILTFWGTVAQVQNGLLNAQERYFFSLYFLISGFIPFPGARLVLWVLFINLICAAVRHFVFRLQNIGILIIHFGLLTYFVAAFFVFNLAHESHLTLREGQGANLTASYHDWELSVWPETAQAGKRHVYAFDAKDLVPGKILTFAPLNLGVITETYYLNAQAYLSPDDAVTPDFKNDTGIKAITRVAQNKDPEKNVPAAIFSVKPNSGGAERVLLYGGESKPTQIVLGDKTYNFLLRRKRFELPFLVALIDVAMQKHPGTEVARSYESKVKVDYEGVSRESRIYMNNPLRYRNFTLYQATYAIDAMGREISTFAVVRNPAQVMPYISCFIVFAGLATHFLLNAFRGRSVK